MQPCADPVELPAGPLGDKQIGKDWSADRLSLQECGTSKAALVGAVKVLTGAKK